MLRAVYETAGAFFRCCNLYQEILQPDLQCDDLTVIRHIQFSPVIGMSFCRIERLAFRDLFIFGVPQKQMGDFKLFGQFTGSFTVL